MISSLTGDWTSSGDNSSSNVSVLEATELSPLPSFARPKNFERTQRKLIAIANRRLGLLPRADYDEHDAAQSALRSFYKVVDDRGFEELDDSSALWGLLLKIVERKVFRRIERLSAKKRQLPDGEWEDPVYVASQQLDPKLAVEWRETLDEAIAKLEDETLKSVVKLRLEGYTNAEIGAKIDLSERTVQRKLQMVRSILSEIDSE